MTLKVDRIRLCRWCHERDLNSRPPAYESGRLLFFILLIALLKPFVKGFNIFLIPIIVL